MARKLKILAAGASERKLAATVRRSAKEIWYAGLGVFATTRDEGSKVYRALVKEGKRVESTARKVARSQIAQVRGQFSRATSMATRQATATWGSVERNLARRLSVVKARVSKLRGAKKAARRAPARRAKKRAHA
jgi:poly(hydroxyalkanoate) granule-associated protein